MIKKFYSYKQFHRMFYRLLHTITTKTSAHKYNHHCSAFLGIDVAFALLIMSFALLSLFMIQNTIINQIKKNDVSQFQTANQNLLTHIKQGKAQPQLIISNNQQHYQVSKIEGQSNMMSLTLYQIP